jgi:hypothetical protein
MGRELTGRRNGGENARERMGGRPRSKRFGERFGMRRISPWRAALTLAAVLFASAAFPGVSPVQNPGAVDLKPGQEVIIPVTIADGRVTLGAARLSRAGTAQPRNGEITVSMVKHGLSPYADLSASEKTSEPVDFVATGLVGDIKIDEVVICGRLDAPAANRIASGSWRVSLNRFSVRQNGQDCRQ